MRWKHLLCAVATVAFATSPAFAQTTGSVIGTVTDPQGAVLPGVTVSATSPQLQGDRTAVTDSTGTFRIPSLPPGTYKVKVTLSGFQDATQENVTVSLDKTSSVNVKMQLAGVNATVDVTAQSPTIDTTSAAGGVTVDQAMMQKLPVARNFYATAQFAPGVTSDAVGPTMMGSSGAENKYIIDGIDATGIQTGSQMKTLLVDFIDQVNVKTEGANAEFGGFTGGMVEAVTKSGSNQFSGSAFVFGQGGSLQQTNDTASKRPQTTTTVSNIAHQYDGGFTLGGPIMRDRLWFYGGYNPFQEKDASNVIRPIGTTPGTPGVGSSVPLTTDRNLYVGKATYKAGKNQTVEFSINGDPSTLNGALFAIAGPPSTWSGTEKTGSADFRGSYNGVFANNWLITGLAARHHEIQTFTGDGASTPLLIDATQSPNLRSGGFGGFEDHNYKRDIYKADLTKYQGKHTFKGGFMGMKVDSLDQRYSGGAGQTIYTLCSVAVPNGTSCGAVGGFLYYRHRYFVNDQATGFSTSDPTTWQIALPLSSEPINHNYGAYGQDQWRVLPNLTIEGGVRWEERNLGDRFGKSVINLNKNWAPRIGFSWDPKNDGKGKIFAFYGIYYEDIPMDINIRAFGGELTAFAYNTDPSPSNIIPVAGLPSKNSLLGSGVEPVDPNLKGQYVQEFLIGTEREIASSLSVGIRYNHRELKNVIEDFLIPSLGEYRIANPGQGTLGQTMGFYDGVSTAPAPLAKRVSDIVELTATKRFTNNWQLLASYTWQKLEGNYDGTFQDSTGQLDPNINSAFDYADFLVNAQGKLTNDRTNQIKVDASYTVSKGALNNLELGVVSHWYSGVPETAYGYSFAYQNWEYYLTPRGSLGTGPSDYDADVHIGYPIKVGGHARATINADIFNVLGRQAITVFDQRYNLTQDGHCAGIPAANCNGDGGLLAQPNSIIPVAQLANPIATATNPDFLKAGTNFTGQRSLRLGVRFTF
jgi:Carboxypeptidase regulatory-like domain/TonB dependent receptor